MRRTGEQEFGKDKVYELPLRVYYPCQPKLRGQKMIKQAMVKVPPYAALLDKYLDARVSMRQ